MQIKVFPGIVFLIILTVLILLTVQDNAHAVQIGGKIEFQSGLNYSDQITANFSGTGELEFYLPAKKDLEARLVLRAALADGRPEIGIKYFYLRQGHGHGHVTLGRQPVSWGYGAFLNPLGYGFGVEGLAGETHVPSVDGIRYFHSLGDGASFQLVTSFPRGLTGKSLDRLGYGGRLRFPVPGHDFSLNFSYQPLRLPPGPDKDNLLRTGITYSGDAGPVGIYGALGYFFLQEAEKEDIVAQLGLDYSWQVGPEFEERTVFLQVEYMRFLKRELGPEVLLRLGNVPAQGVFRKGVYDLLLANISLLLDPFTQIGTAFLAETKDGSLALAPYYISDLGGGVELNISGNLLFSETGDFSAGTSLGLSYYF